MNLLLKKSVNRWCWLLPALAVLWLCCEIGHAQGIIHVQMPPSPSLGMVQDAYTGELFDPFAPYDAQGLRLAGDPLFPVSWNLVINGQTVLTFSAGTSFSVTATGSNAVIGDWGGSNIPALASQYAAPLMAGQVIDENAVGYQWFSGGLLAANRASHEIGLPFLTIGAFAGLESAFLGFEFYQDGEPYYGWARVGNMVGWNWGWVYDYAYETVPNTPIMVGAVPEPGTWVLLGIGGLAFFIIRRKRQLPCK